jgi:hypothetical protein
MTAGPQKTAMLLALALLAGALSGCGTINEKASAAMGNYIPQWAGGLPPDAPPRPGTPQYDAYMQERERQRLIPAAERTPTPQAGQTSQSGQSSGLDPVH